MVTTAAADLLGRTIGQAGNTVPRDSLVDTRARQYSDRLLIEQTELKAEALPLSFGIGLGERLAKSLLLSIYGLEYRMERLHPLCDTSDFTFQSNAFGSRGHTGHDGGLEAVDKFINVARHGLNIVGVHYFTPKALVTGLVNQEVSA
jgi:hypothetical protein